MRYIKYWDNQELDPIIKRRFNKSLSKRYMKAHPRRGGWTHRWSQLELIEMRRKFNEFIDNNAIQIWDRGDRTYFVIDECYDNKIVQSDGPFWARTAIRMYLFLRDYDLEEYIAEDKISLKFIEMLREFHDKLKCGRKFGKDEEEE